MIVRVARRQVDRETYNSVAAELDIDRQHPLGLIVHGASEVDGVMYVVQIWESEEYARRYEQERLAPAMEAVGAPPGADITYFSLHHLVTP